MPTEIRVAATISGSTWTNLSAAVLSVDDANEAHAHVVELSSEWIACTNFGFNIPIDSTINSVTILSATSTTGTCTVWLSKTIDNPTVSQVNALGYGVNIVVTEDSNVDGVGYIDYIALEVEWTSGAPGMIPEWAEATSSASAPSLTRVGKPAPSRANATANAPPPLTRYRYKIGGRANAAAASRAALTRVQGGTPGGMVAAIGTAGATMVPVPVRYRFKLGGKMNAGSTAGIPALTPILTGRYTVRTMRAVAASSTTVLRKGTGVNPDFGMNTYIANAGARINAAQLSTVGRTKILTFLRMNAYATTYMGYMSIDFRSLLDGNLSVKIAGVERVTAVHGLEWETTNQGDGAGSFWMEVANPFSPQTDYPEVRHGATVVVTHTIVNTETILYSGYIVSDPRAGYAGEKSIITVECGGILDVISGRTDMGYIFTDSDTSQWFENKRTLKCYQTDTSDRIDIRVGDDVKVKHDIAGIVGYVPYLGASHLLNVLPGAKRITGQVSYDLHDNMRAGLFWAENYTSSRDVSNPVYHLIHEWGTNTKIDNHPFGTNGGGYTFGGTQGAGYLILALWTTKTGGVKTTGERFVQLEYVDVYTGTTQVTIDRAMLKVAQTAGLGDHTDAGPNIRTIGNVLPGLVARPYMDHAAAMASFAAQADCLVEWGYFKGQFRARPMAKNPVTIHALPNCYEIDAEAPGVVWEVTQHPEDFIPRSIRFLYGHTGKSNWPAGSPAQCIASIAGKSGPGWSPGKPFLGACAPVITVDFSNHNYTDDAAKKIAKKLATHLGVALSGGTVQLTCPVVNVHSGGSQVPSAYIRGADWIECTQSAAGPLYITSSKVNVDDGLVELTVGLSEDLLLEQLEAAGNPRRVKKHKKYRRARR